MNNKLIVCLVLLLFVAGAAGYWFGKSSHSAGSEVDVSSRSSSGDEQNPLFYRHPMNPEITSPVPAKGSMGMDYIAVYASDAENNAVAGTVRIDSIAQQNIGVRTVRAEIASLSRSVRAVGRIDYDERRITQLHPKIDGWIEKLYVDITGEQVEKDTILLGLYSPKLVASQQEYVLALRNYETLKNSPVADIRNGARELMQSSRARLEFFDVPEHQILELEKTRTPQKTLHIHSPAAGIVTRIGAREGQHVTPQTELYMIADLSRVWVYADIFENDLAWVKLGDAVDMTLASIPGENFQGRVAYIYPYAETKTRTVKIRIELDNPELKLKPETFAQIIVRASQQDQAIVIPAESVVRSGSVNRVFVVRAPGEFEPREVELGLQADGRVIVLAGLEAGEEVVSSAQFLIDSESSLREATAKMLDSKEALQ